MGRELARRDVSHRWSRDEIAKLLRPTALTYHTRQTQPRQATASRHPQPLASLQGLKIEREPGV